MMGSRKGKCKVSGIQGAQGFKPGHDISSTPTGLRLPAQGCEALRATLGSEGKFRSTPKVLRPYIIPRTVGLNGHNPVGVEDSFLPITRGCSKAREPWAVRRNTFGVQSQESVRNDPKIHRCNLTTEFRCCPSGQKNHKLAACGYGFSLCTPASRRQMRATLASEPAGRWRAQGKHRRHPRTFHGRAGVLP